MPSAPRSVLIGACAAAVDYAAALPPGARLWLARASLHCDEKGRTRYGPERYRDDTGDSGGQTAIDWLIRDGLVTHDHDDAGIECWRLGHYDFERGQVIGGYSRDAGSRRDGLPPQYGRSVRDVIEPNGKPYRPPSTDSWRALVTEED